MRTRFNKTEQTAFVLGAEVEVRNGRFWYPAVVVGPIETPAGSVFQEVPCRVTGTEGRKGTVRTGDVWSATPTTVRSLA